MHYFKKNLLKFFNGHIHSLLRPIVKSWVLFYSLELEEFENFLLSLYSNVFVQNTRLFAHGSRSQIFGVLGNKNNFLLEYATIFNI